jgi:drug/metabolite transporter (DMT)-like permease
MTRRSWLLFAAMCVIWGIPYLLIRVAVRDIAPGTLVFLRTGIGGLILLPLALRAGGFRPVLRRWAPLLLFSVLEMAIPWLMLSQAEQRLSSSLSGLLIAAVPLVGVVVAWVSKADERTDRWQLLGLLVGLVGVAVLVGVDFGSIDSVALVEVLIVVLGYAIAPAILARKLADLPSLPVVCASLLLVAVGYLPYAAVRMPTDVAATGWWSVATLALVCTALAFVLFFALIAAIGPTRATVITYVNPAVALLCGIVFLDESFTLGMAVGFPLILLGSVLGARHRGNRALAEPEPAQSMRTGPDDVSNTAATTPVP